MSTARCAKGILFSLAGLTFGLVHGQDFPHKPIRIITGTAGASLDYAARLMAQGAAGSLGQPVIVDNRAGVLSGELVAKAPPDGYTLLYAASSIWLAPFMQKVAYDPLKD